MNNSSQLMTRQQNAFDKMLKLLIALTFCIGDNLKVIKVVTLALTLLFWPLLSLSYLISQISQYLEYYFIIQF